MKKLHVLYFAILFCSSISSQEKIPDKQTKVPLENLVLDLQNKFKIIISFNSKVAENKIVTYKKLPLKLEVIFNMLENQFPIKFTKIDAVNYVLKSVNIQDFITVCGYVFDAKTKQRLEGVSIFYKKIQRGTITDKDGYFKLENIDKNVTVQIHSLGYKKQLISARDFSKKCLTINLEEQVFNLDEIIISEFLTSGFYKNKDGSIKATPGEFGVLPSLLEPDVLQSLQLIPGIQSPNETTTGLNIRGGTPDQNLILWDGIKMYYYDHFFGMISSFNPNLVKDVKVFTNGSSARYRSNLSGVIDINSVSEIPEKTEAGFGFNMIYLDAFVKTPINKNSAFFFSARRSYADILETVTFDEFSEQVFQNTKISGRNSTFSDVLSKTRNEYYFTDYTAKLISKLNDKSTLTFSSIYSKNNLDFESQFDEIDQWTNDRLNITNKGFSLNLENKWSKNFIVNANLNFSDYNFDYHGQELLSRLFSYETIKQNKVKDFGMYLLTQYNLDEKQSIVNGYNVSFNELSYTIGNSSDVVFDNDFSITSKDERNTTHSLFSEYHFNTKKWNINAGLRLNYLTNISDFFLEPRIHVSRNLGNNFIVNFSGEKKYQFTSQIIEFETQNFGLENQIWVLSDNDRVPVLETEQIALGLSKKKNDWFINLETYLRKNKNLTSITKGFNRELDANEFSIGNSTVLGTDVLVKKRFDNFTSLISYSLTENTFSFNNLNDTKSFSGNFDIRHYLSFIQSASFGNLELSLGWKFRTSKPYTPAFGLLGDNANNIRIDYGEINSVRLSNYHRLDFSAKYKFKPFKNGNIKATFGFSLLNVYNQKNILNRTYRIIIDTKTASYDLSERNKFSLDRTPNFVFRLDF